VNKIKLKRSVMAPLLALVIYALLFLSRFLDLSAFAENDSEFLIAAIMQIIIVMLPAIAYCKIKGEGYIEKLNVRFFKPSYIPLIIYLFFVMTLGGMLLNLFLFKIGLIRPGTSSFSSYDPILGESYFYPAYSVLAFAVVPAISEEFFFRGIMFDEYKGYGAVTAIVISSLLFSMMHFSFEFLLVYLFCGFVLGLCAYITRSLLAVTVLHFLYNLFQLFGEAYMWNVFANQKSVIFFIFICTSTFIIFVMLAAGQAEKIFFKLGTNPESEEIPEGHGFIPREKIPGSVNPLIRALLSPTFLACAVLYFITVLIQ